MDREMDVLITEMPESYTWKGEGKNLSFLSKKKKQKTKNKKTSSETSI